MRGAAFVGGFTGLPSTGDYARNWSSGEVSGSGSFAGGFTGAAISGGYEYIYWNEDSSGISTPGSGEAAVVQTLVASNFGGDDAAWAGLDDNDDFPLLTVHSRPWQAVNLASALTRVLVVNDGGASDAAGIDLATANEIRLDTNGLAPDTGSGGTSIPTCEFVNGELRAQTNYNGVMVKLTMMTGGDERFAARSGCEVGFQNVTGEFAATLRVEISAPAMVIDSTRTDLARSLTTDYALRITMDANTAARDEFVRKIEEDNFDWFAASLTVAGGTPGNWDGDSFENRYDWTPTSISVGGVLTQVDLLDGATGAVGNPYPIYNVWQLQAIDGIRVDAGVTTNVDFRLFGATVARLGSHYRLAANIDASPTRDWQTIGFNPIGDPDNGFVGLFDGEGREIRGLFMNSSEANAALFDEVRAGGRVARLGLRDMDARARDGGFRAAGAVARLNGGTVSLVWASGTAQGAEFNNAGLIGYLLSGELRESWFVGDIIGGGGNGGLVGLMAAGEIADSWAMAQVRQTSDNRPNGGLIGRASGGTLTTSWSGGPVADGENSGGIIGRSNSGSDSVLAGGAIYLDTSTSGGSKAKANDVAASISLVETMVTVNSGLGAAWFYGDKDDTDYPFLREFDAGLQAAHFADFQTRILPGVGGEELPTAGRTPMGIGEVITLTLDSNGLATGAATPTPTCADTDAAGVRVAKTNYNDVMVRLRTTGEGSAEFTEDCKILIRLAGGDATLVAVEALIVSREETISNWTHSFELDAERVFLYEIATGARQWRGDGDADDWDGDGVANPYDWTPTSVTIGGVEIEVNLNMSDADGSEGNPYPIYNVWQLQAIDGVSVSSQGDVDGNVTLSLFGDDAATRLGAQYRLAMDIDAAPTKEWDSDAGFNPIGESGDGFVGLLNGDGFAVRNLFIDRSGNDIGLFAEISNVLAVRNMGVEDADIRGGANIGILAGGLSGGSIGRVWTTGKVVGSGNNVGGLVGFLFNTDQSTVMMSWSAADVRGANGVGGLVGQNSVAGDQTAFSDNWAGGDVNGVAGGAANAAGLVGLSNGGAFTRNWSSGAISGNNRAGFVAGGGANNTYTGAHWNLDTSGFSSATGVGIGGVVQTLAASDFGGEAAAAAWAGLDDNADFPLLADLSRPWQAVNLARVLTRIFGIETATQTEAAAGITFTTNGVRLDTNGLAANTGSGGTSIPTCAVVGGELQAQTNYNGVMVKLALMTGGDEEMVAVARTNTHCEVEFANAENEFAATLRLEISAPSIGDDAARVLVTDYALRIAPDLLPEARDEFVRRIATADDWFSDALIIEGVGSSGDWDGDGIANPYDWTPTSVTIMVDGVEIEVGVNLTLGGVDPWPIYNIWQLQAIDGVVPADATMGLSSQAASASQTAGQNLFGANQDTRLGANYRLARNIDATPTGAWDGARGFNPIGAFSVGSRFNGVFDGGGNVVRGLRIFRAGLDSVGLFAAITGGAERVVNLGLDDARIRGRDSVGAIVGAISPQTIRAVWARGSVQGREAVGGLIGDSDGGILSESWFAGRVEGNDFVGGLAGAAISSSNLSDSWAAVDIVAPAGAQAGELAGDANSTGINNLRRLWGEGYLSADDFLASGGNLLSVYTDDIRALDLTDFESEEIWNVGTSSDFPILTVHSAATQAAAIAYGLTRASVFNELALGGNQTRITYASPTIVFDLNGDAADSVCDANADGVIATGYNGATVSVSFPTGVTPAEGVCGYVLTGFDSDSMRLKVSFLAGGDSIAREYLLVADTARRSFLAEMAADPARWLDDDDGDDIINTYDWTPNGAGNLDLRVDDGVMANGTRARPYPVFNIWQLQAIGGVVPAEATTGLSSDAASASQDAGQNILYGAQNARLIAAYRMQFDIDATQTRNWDDGKGFSPIGLSGGAFGGSFDGGGNVVRDLHIDRPDTSGVGLFSFVRGATSATARIANLGLDDARITGNQSVGAIVGFAQNAVELDSVWARGRVRGDDDAVGGLVGRTSPNTNLKFDMDSSWFAGQVAGGGSNGLVGGLVGDAQGAANVELTDSWAAADIVASNGTAGELTGRSVGAALLRSWGDGYLSANTTVSHDNEQSTYYDGILTLTLAAFENEPIWNVGTNSDFPILTVNSAATQGAAIAYGLTRASVVGGRVLSEEEPTIVPPSPTIVFDLNGDAADPDPACVANANGSIATGYNGATVSVSFPAGVSPAVAAGVCGYVLAGFDSDGALTVSFLAGGDSIAREYPLQIDGTPAFVDDIAGDFDWFSPDLIVAGVGNSIDWDGDGIANPYDWTPIPRVDLTAGLTGPGGTTDNPWPIYNVWHLQAIDGVSVSSQGAVDGDVTLSLFGDSASERLGAQYRLALDIDATPTRGWAGGGFRPIGDLTFKVNLSANPSGDFFQGVLNGDGRQIRGLSVNMINMNEIQHVGLFSAIGGAGKVVSLQLSDLFVRGGSSATGGLVGISEGLVSLVGVAGAVTGGSNAAVRVGGLAGWAREDVVESWFVGEVRGNQAGSTEGMGIGGLIGRFLNGKGDDNIELRNNWAQARVVETNSQGNNRVGGLVGHFRGLFRNGWSGGEAFGQDRNNRGLIGLVDSTAGRGDGGYLDRSTSGSTNPLVGGRVSAQGVATMVTVTVGLGSAWNYGGATGYPFLARYETMRPGAQALAYANFQTRIFSAAAGGDEFLSGGRMEFAPGENPTLTLDTNGAATGAPAPVPTCAADSDGVIVAKTNYNDVTVRLRATGDGSAVFTNDCKIVIVVAGRDVLVEALIATGEATISSWSYLFARDSSVIFGFEFDAVSSPVSVAAAAGINAKVLTVSLREGATPSFNDAADANFKAAGGGVQATVSLARAATAIFDSDDATLDFVVTASDNIVGVIDTQALMVQFVSEPRAISAERLDLVLNLREVIENAVIIDAAQAASISIWHYDNAAEEYNLSQSGAGRFSFDSGTGVVKTTRPLLVGFYGFTLRLTGGGEVASLPVSLRVISDAPVINAPAGPMVVPTDAGENVLVATIPLLGMGAIAATTNGDLQTGGGDDEALVTLTRAAADAFSSDNLILSLVLRASGPDGSDTATIRFVSTPRAIDKEELLLSVFLIEATVGAEILAGGASQLSIWHNGDGDSEVYSLEQAGANFGFDPATGLVTAAVSLAEDVYPITLHLNDGDDLRATRVLRVSVFENPERAALRIFLEEIEAGDFDWFAARNAENPAYDWDGDDIANPYDWTPTSVTVMVNGAQVAVEVNLTLDGVDPWPVYNIWQLQAIDGVVPAETTARFSSDADAVSASQTAGENLYGDSSSARRGATYLLANNIDATPTRNWDGARGFNPIGNDGNTPFYGAFDGGGNVVRGLHIDRADLDNVGLFAQLSRPGPANPPPRVVNLGLDDVRIRGGNNVGAIAGVTGNQGTELRAVWARGRVRGAIDVGGLVGDFGTRLFDSWFAGQVEGNAAVGGLVGAAFVAENIRDSWAAVDIVAPADSTSAGELVGDEDSSNLLRLWGEGYLSADSRSSDGGAQSTYYDNIRTRNAAAFGSAPIWNVGSVGADGDFPTLTVHSAATQGAGHRLRLDSRVRRRRAGVVGRTADACFRFADDCFRSQWRRRRFRSRLRCERGRGDSDRLQQRDHKRVFADRGCGGGGRLRLCFACFRFRQDDADGVVCVGRRFDHARISVGARPDA